MTEKTSIDLVFEHRDRLGNRTEVACPMRRKYNFATAIGIFVSVRCFGPVPVKDEPDPPTPEATRIAAEALRAHQASPAMIKAAMAFHAAYRRPGMDDTIWHDPPIFLDSAMG